MFYGYARVSTPQQSIDRQIRNIRQEYPDALIVQEVYTGTKLDRTVWNRLHDIVKSGDKIVFDSVSRMGRSTERRRRGPSLGRAKAADGEPSGVRGNSLCPLTGCTWGEIWTPFRQAADVSPRTEGRHQVGRMYGNQRSQARI